ncbi:MAG: serine/threonine protein kinase [Sandaracinus sp.]|nr:serine/threonine protein kinase [Sandaracinus sp.]
MREELEQLLGTTIAEKYRLDRLLGHGGMGAVFAAENTWTKQDVALKILLDQEDADDETIKRFVREAKTSVRLVHPNVVRVFDLGHQPGSGWFIVQELLQGQTLRERLHEKPKLALSEALQVLVPIAVALRFVHEEGIVHRDLKPGNIFLARDGADVEPKLIDFGISKVVQRRTGSLSVSDLTKGSTIGTLDYISPEQAVGDEALGPTADVWSFGAVLFRLLSGRPPHESKGLAVIGKLLREDPVRLDAIEPSVPKSIADTVQRMLARDPAQRTPSMGKVLFELLSDDAVLETTWGRSLAREYADSCDGELPAFADDETSSSIRPPPATSSASTVASWLPWVLAAVSSAVATWALLR